MKRERLTITLDQDLLKAVDSLVDKERLRNRSQTIEYLLKQGLGLHQLEQAFLFLEENWDQSQLEPLIALLQESSITTLYLGGSKLPDAELLIRSANPDWHLQTVPMDFGSGGVLILQKNQLKTPFLVTWIGADLRVPGTLLAPYLFHREHNQLVTQLLHTSDGKTFHNAELYLADPDLLPYIPAGVTDLKVDVFPPLLKQHKIEGYVFS